MQRAMLAAFIAGLFSLPAQAKFTQEIPLLDDILVTATRVPTSDVLAPYASEVHTRGMIEQSGASSLYDYLSQRTSVQVLPGFGNKYTPKLDMRGYGIGDGYQNIVVTLDGRRLNNIDTVGQLIGSIPLADIERIEITKGSGSVMFGDGATAGSIQIITRPHTGVSVHVSAGNAGAIAGTVTAGVKKQRVSLSASADYSSMNGYSDADVTGHKDASSNRTWRGGFELRPVDRLKLGLDLSSTRIDTRYPGPLTLAEFSADPAQNSGNTYTHQVLESDLWGVSAGLEIRHGLTLTVKHGREDKLSNFVTGSFKSDYDYTSDELALQHRGESLDFTMGVQYFDGTRIDRNGFGDNDTSKRNIGWFAQGQYRSGAVTYSAGMRHEDVRYVYAPLIGAALEADHALNAWDIGMNYRMDDALSVFANYNRAFQTPDIDRFFLFGGGFNAFIDPAISHTINLGLNHTTPRNRLKLTLFRANLDNEIYFNAGTFTNTNLDKTHKYGLELQDVWRVSEPVTINLNYAYTRAVIDRENDGGGAMNGKDLPGVPRHGVTLGLAYQWPNASSLYVNHVWRSSAHAADDFANTFTQKQAAYQSTNVAWHYRQKNVEWFAGIQNLFARKNGLWVRDNAIYPVDFTRNWRVGVKATF